MGPGLSSETRPGRIRPKDQSYGAASRGSKPAHSDIAGVFNREDESFTKLGRLGSVLYQAKPACGEEKPGIHTVLTFVGCISINPCPDYRICVHSDSVKFWVHICWVVALDLGCIFVVQICFGMASTQESQIVSVFDASVDSSPLLASSAGSTNDSGTAERPTVTRRGRISRVFNIIRRQSGRGLMREPSVLVRETAAEHFEERQSEWAYSRPVVILDLIWNLIFVTVAFVVLLISTQERPSNPLRIWVLGYAAQCCIHVACVWVEFKRRRSNGSNRYGTGTPSYTSNEADLPFPERFRANQNVDRAFEEVMASQLSTAKRVESANTSFSFVWWVLGFYWTTTGNQSQNAPLLFWLCAAFLAFDVFFVVFCVSLACIIGIAVCCCLPCIIALMYAVAEQEGASEEDINMLPKYKFRQTGSFPKAGEDMTGPSGGVLSILGPLAGAAEERELPAVDAECCICLCSYEDGVEVRELQCSHHFHCTCIDRWLRMNSTCPLCKFNVSKDGHARRGEDA